MRNDQVGLQWSATELDMEGCGGCLHVESEGFSPRSGAHCSVPCKSAPAGRWVCDRRLRSLYWKSEGSKAEAEESALEARRCIQTEGEDRSSSREQNLIRPSSLLHHPGDEPP